MKKYLVRFLHAVVFIKLTLIPVIILACAVCFSGKEETLEAFYITTILLTILPIAMIAFIGIWLYKKYRNFS